MHALRTKFKKEIISEFVPPAGKSSKVIILAGGMPGVPKNKELLFFLAKKGLWVFMPRYRGSWESDGQFLKKSPEQDILDIIDELPKGFTDLWSGKKYTIKNPEVYVIGGSFGGPAAILASKDKRVKKVVAISSVIDWRVDSKEEPMGKLGKFVREAFGNGYRFAQKDWDRLARGEFYNPISEWPTLDPKKIFVIHTKDDEVCQYSLAEKFACLTGCYFLPIHKGGHIGFGILTEPTFWRKVQIFLKK